MTRMANEMKRAGANSMGVKRGYNSCSLTGNHCSFRGFDLGFLKQESFREAQGVKEQLRADRGGSVGRNEITDSGKTFTEAQICST